MVPRVLYVIPHRAGRNCVISRCTVCRYITRRLYRMYLGTTWNIITVILLKKALNSALNNCNIVENDVKLRRGITGKLLKKMLNSALVHNCINVENGVKLRRGISVILLKMTLNSAVV